MCPDRPFRFSAPLYPIIDTLGEPSRSYYELAEAILSAGARLVQLRVKHGSTRSFMEVARAVQRLAAARDALLIINDRADIAAAIGAAGVHLGQDDLPPDDARRMLGPEKIIGWSTHSVEQIAAAERLRVLDYIGFGPIFPTSSKERPDPTQGLPGLRRARAVTKLPLVAIGGITAATMQSVLAAGADAVAMIGEIVRAPDPAALVAGLLRI